MDIDKCTGEGCLIANSCKRYYSDKNKKYTNKYSYYIKPPFKIKKGVFSCELFFGFGQDLVLQQIKDYFKL